MRILYYNWVDYNDPQGRGGGVTTYQRNLVRALQANPAHSVTFLSAGLSYDLPTRAPRWEPQRFTTTPNAYDLVNSAVLAPAHHSFGDAAQLHDPASQAAFFDFIAKTGPYDVIHFNNLEGVPASVLALKTHWPQTRLILSLHNYYPLCPQVNLWFQESHTCDDYANGANCVTCLPHRHDGRLLRLANGLSYRLKAMGLRPGTWGFDAAFYTLLRIGSRTNRALSWVKRKLRTPLPKPAQTHSFATRRTQMVALINTHCDAVLCVSNAVKTIATAHGIAPKITHASYIGTAQAAHFATTKPRPILAPDGTLHLAYLGYMRRDKGFFFLLDTLETLPETTLNRLHLTIAAKRGDAPTMARITALTPRMASLTHIDGYTHDTLDDILTTTNAGLVPVLWHDNLPQVAIEMHARHIPLITANIGGARELGNTPEMTFAAGNAPALAARITAILNGEIDLNTYWSNAMPPPTMADHLSDLMQHYTPAPLPADHG
jgi:glycosyltransferase involved in cell wall biosynthesis